MLAYGLLTRPYRYAILNSFGLVGYWPFNETSGTVAVDAMGRNNLAYVATPTLGVVGAVVGDPSNAVTFNGTTQWATLASGFTVGDVFTLAVWLKRGRLTTQETFMVSGSGTNASFQINATDSPRLVKAGGGVITVSTVTIAETTNWHFLAWTRTGGGSSDKLFLDGVNVTGSLTSFTGLAMTGVRFGSDVGSGPCSCTMQHGAIWNRAMAQTEIVNYYRLGRGF